MGIVAEAAAAYANAGYFTLIDGIVLPEWFLIPLSEVLDGTGHRVAYAVLREPVSVCTARVQAREGDPALVDADVIEQIWRGFEDLGDRERNALDLEGRSPEQVADLLAQQLSDGHLSLR
jgi:predicted kinase